MDADEKTLNPAPDTTETVVSVAESASSFPSWLLIIVMGLAVMIAARPRKEPLDRFGR